LDKDKHSRRHSSAQSEDKPFQLFAEVEGSHSKEHPSGIFFSFGWRAPGKDGMDKSAYAAGKGGVQPVIEKDSGMRERAGLYGKRPTREHISKP
jgi:hypothetical protein